MWRHFKARGFLITAHRPGCELMSRFLGDSQRVWRKLRIVILFMWFFAPCVSVASDAKEQQFWISQLQACARRHSDSSAKVHTQTHTHTHTHREICKYGPSSWDVLYVKWVESLNISLEIPVPRRVWVNKCDKFPISVNSGQVHEFMSVFHHVENLSTVTKGPGPSPFLSVLLLVHF